MTDQSDPLDRDTWGDVFPISVDSVMRAWMRLVRGIEPWSSMPRDDRGGEMRRVLVELLDTGGGTDSPARRRRIRSVAMCHGAFRYGQRCPEEVVVDDFLLVRDAVRDALRVAGVPPARAAPFVRGVQSDCQFARHAARTLYPKSR